jgi:zinc transporter ZupT
MLHLTLTGSALPVRPARARINRRRSTARYTDASMALGQKTQLKVVSLCTLLGEGLLGGLLPVFVRALRREGPALESAHGFSGGVILSIAVLHMLVDAIDAQADATPLTYPFWAIFTSIGLLILVFVEYVVVPSASDRSKDVLDSLRQPLVAMAALSLHSFLEGLAIGIQDTLSQIRTLFIGVASHKLIAGLGLGIKLSRKGIFPTTTALVILAFATMSPAGIALGMALTGLNHWLELILQSTAAGTFLYVGIIQSLELATPGSSSNAETQLSFSQQQQQQQQQQREQARQLDGLEKGDTTGDHEQIMLAGVDRKERVNSCGEHQPAGARRPAWTKWLPHITFSIGACILAISIIFDE